VAIKAENENDDVAEVQTAIQEIVSAHEDRFYMENHLPSLGLVRGKIILARRYDDMIHAGEKGGMHLEWKDQGSREAAASPFAVRDVNDALVVAVQDRYRYDVQDKWNAFDYTLTNCPANQWTISINFLSTMTGSKIPHPRAYAGELNSMFLEKDLEPGKMYGILAFDFITREMAEKVIASNGL
jgi:1-phosphatidylinositol phosphodiesterase